MARLSAKHKILDGIEKSLLPPEESRSLALIDECSVLEKSLFAFINAAWPVVEGTNPFFSGWHIEAICLHLEALFRGKIKDPLIINVPPRTSKTTIISIMWPAWIWTQSPGIKFLFASYSLKISLEHSRLCRMLIESPWYQARWGHVVQLSGDQAAKWHFSNTALGYRIATSVGAAGTALGGDILVMDDPNSTNDSKVVRESTNEWASRVWPSRLNPRGLGISVLVQQRTDETDVTGYWLSKNAEKRVEALILPMEYESSRHTKTSIGWEDPRKEDGELLCPQYLGKLDIAHRKVELGSYNYAGQYQQRPAPEAGGILQKSWFRWWIRESPPKMDYVIQSWDTALTAKETSAYSACTTWGVFRDENDIQNLILLSAWRGRVTYKDLLERALRLYENWCDIEEEPLEQNSRMMPDYLVIEAKASGHTLASDFTSKGIPVHGFDPTGYGDKVQRVHRVSPWIQSGFVWVAAKPNTYKVLRKDHQMFVDNCAIFPKGDSTDIVDTGSQAMLVLIMEKGMLRHSMDYGFKQKGFEDRYQPGYVKAAPKENRGVFASED